MCAGQVRTPATEIEGLSSLLLFLPAVPRFCLASWRTPTRAVLCRGSCVEYCDDIRVVQDDERPDTNRKTDDEARTTRQHRHERSREAEFPTPCPLNTTPTDKNGEVY